MATGQDHVPVPAFAGPFHYQMLPEPGALAVTPPGFDLVGTGTSLVADGYPEVAVAAELEGFVRIYRNQNTWASAPAASLTTAFDIDIFGPLGITVDIGGGTSRITEIDLVDMTGDMVPDLVVSAISVENVNGEDTEVGHIAHFKAVVNGLEQVTGFSHKSSLVLDLPVTGFTVADYTNEGRKDVLAACVPAPSEPTINASRVFVIRNDSDGTEGGVLFHHMPDEFFPAGFNTSANIVSGEFKRLTVGGFGFSGTTLDFVSFGGSPENSLDGAVVFGEGTGAGAFTFVLHSKKDDSCNFGIDGLGDGTYTAAPSSLPTIPMPLVKFDPFVNTDQSLATAQSNTRVRMIHNRPRYGVFYHLCGTSDVDQYIVDDNDCGGGLPPPINFIIPDLASGNLNSDPFDDLVHLDPVAQRATFLLGRGTPDSENRIMQYVCGDPRYHYKNYGGISSDVLKNRVICGDLNQDGYDEIIISRYGRTATDHGDAWSLIVYRNDQITTP